ncbi:DUF3830 family protein [Nocardiopsis sp. B62]|uniref:cucumopine synthase-related protein n=1 Tax=Nocardiopsis sp. B62 TaxID=2824874 RepID=UPI001B371248|nr:DUF3830 family protein [Nocardiopsis sp. B62]MBQ1083064.1 DUF3830 family protein [Nocardiopsis sp. B62]
MRQLEIEWVQPQITVTADLTDDNPDLVDMVWNRLVPYNSLQNHALVSGDHLYHLLPSSETVYRTPEYKMEDRTVAPDGTVFLSQLQHIGIKYGPLTEYLPAAPIGRVVPDDVDALREAGQHCWDAAYRTKEAVEIRVRRKGDQVTDYALPLPPRVGIPDVQDLIDEIHDATQRSWIEPPEEIVDIHAGRISSRAGSRDQFFSTMVFVNGEVRPLGYNALNGLLRLVRTTALTLDTLREITPGFIRTPSEFLGYTGLHTLERFTKETTDALARLEDREQYFALISTLALYTNMLNTWNLHLFPWDHGKEYPYAER